MARRGGLMRRSAAQWGVRGVLALATAALGYAGVARTIGYSMRGGNVARAHALAPGDGRVTALLAQSIAGVEATPADRKRADVLARDALRQDPTAVAAVSTLGLDAELRGDRTSARRLFAYAQRLSRRDLRTQVWAIETAVVHGDIAGALHHYDIALRTSRDAPDLLFPILVQAIGDPAVRAALVRILAARPLWTQPFVEYAAAREGGAEARAPLFAGLARAGVPISASARGATTDALIKGGRFDQAWAYYLTFHPGADRRRSRDPGFTAGEAPSPFDWTPVDASGASATIAGGMADVTVAGSLGGAVMRQLQLLPPGVYRLDGHASFPDQAGGAMPYWALTCLDGRELGRVPLSPTAAATFGGRFTVPPGCAVQYLSLVLQPSDGVGGTGVRIDRALLAPAGSDAGA